MTACPLAGIIWMGFFYILYVGHVEVTTDEVTTVMTSLITTTREGEGISNVAIAVIVAFVLVFVIAASVTIGVCCCKKSKKLLCFMPNSDSV